MKKYRSYFLGGGIFIAFLYLLLPHSGATVISLYPSWSLISYCSFLIGVIGSLYLLLTARGLLRLKKSDLLIISFYIYLLLFYLYTEAPYNRENIAETGCLLLGYLIIRQVAHPFLPRLLLLFPVACLLRLIYSCYDQLYGFAYGYHLYQMNGGFFNTSLWGGFLAVTLTIHCGLAFQGQFFQKNLLRWSLWCIGFCCFTTLLFYTDSRAAWLSGLTGISVLLYTRYSPVLKHFLKPYRIPVIIALVGIFFNGILFLYQHKPISTDGRIQIHRITLDMIKAKPWPGWGAKGFSRYYMDWQAGYFTKHPQATGSQLADETIFAFNEYLRLLTEHGLIKGFLILSIFIFILARPPRNTGDHIHLIYRCAIIALIVFGFFSYPFSFFEFNIIATILLAGFVSGCRDDLPSWNHPDSLRLIVTVCILCSGVALSYFSNLQSRACNKWMQALTHYSTSPQQTLRELQPLYPTLGDHPVFLFTYGKALNLTGQYSQALPILQQSMRQQSSYQTLIETGKTLAALQQTEAARECWEKASQMIPNRLLPDFLIAQMYAENHQLTRAQPIARKALLKKIKKDTPETRNMIRKLQEIVQQ